jgi:hypothetical protein
MFKWFKLPEIDDSLKLTVVLIGAMFLVPALAPSLAWAQEASTEVKVNYGAAVASLLEGSGNILFVVVSGAIATFSPGVWAFMRISRLNQLLEGALNKAVEEFREDIEDNTVTVDLRNKVLADAARYALDNGANSIVKWAGGEKGIRDKLQSRFQSAVTKWLASKAD